MLTSTVDPLDAPPGALMESGLPYGSDRSASFQSLVLLPLKVTSLISSLSGCSTGPANNLSKALQVVGGSGTLPPSALTQFNRFKAVAGLDLPVIGLVQLIIRDCDRTGGGICLVL